MAVVRGIGLKVQAGTGRCWATELAWDEDGGLTETGRVVSKCDQPPVTVVLGSGVCEDHGPLFLADRGEGGWSNN